MSFLFDFAEKILILKRQNTPDHEVIYPGFVKAFASNRGMG
jgi:hypothetical protein